MKDLKNIAGVEIKLEDVGLVYDQDVYPVEEKVRTYAEAKDVYLEKEAEDQDLYWMYRYFEAEADADSFEQAKLEYDITAIKAGKIGPEFIKTAGHYHGYVPGTSITYPEVYEVIEGEVEYLLQTKPDAESNVNVVIVGAKAGDKVIVPPNYGHISINVGNSMAVSSNLQYLDLPATADYETFKVNNGGALYRSEPGWDNNGNYNIKSLRKVTPKEKSEWGVEKSTPLYTSFLADPTKFDFLVNPQNYDFSDVWQDVEDF